MNYIAFLRAKNANLPDLPPELIVQTAPFENQTDPWESLLESDFANEFQKNQQLITDYINTTIQFKASMLQSDFEVEKQAMAGNKEEFQLYLQFLDWKNKMAQEQADAKAQEIERLMNIQNGMADTGEIKFTHPTMDRLNQFQNTRMRIR